MQAVDHALVGMVRWAWLGMVRYGMVWYGLVWYGMVWCGMVWYASIGASHAWIPVRYA